MNMWIGIRKLIGAHIPNISGACYEMLGTHGPYLGLRAGHLIWKHTLCTCASMHESWSRVWIPKGWTHTVDMWPGIRKLIGAHMPNISGAYYEMLGTHGPYLGLRTEHLIGKHTLYNYASMHESWTHTAFM